MANTSEEHLSGVVDGKLRDVVAQGVHVAAAALLLDDVGGDGAVTAHSEDFISLAWDVDKGGKFGLLLVEVLVNVAFSSVSVVSKLFTNSSTGLSSLSKSPGLMS